MGVVLDKNQKKSGVIIILAVCAAVLCGFFINDGYAASDGGSVVRKKITLPQNDSAQTDSGVVRKKIEKPAPEASDQTPAEDGGREAEKKDAEPTPGGSGSKASAKAEEKPGAVTKKISPPQAGAPAKEKQPEPDAIQSSVATPEKASKEIEKPQERQPAKVTSERETRPEETPQTVVPSAASSSPEKVVEAAPQPMKAEEGESGKSESVEDLEESITLFYGVNQKKKIYDQTIGYRSEGRVDPFMALFKDEPPQPQAAATPEKQKKGEKPKRTQRTPLEKVDLSQLKLVAIIRAESGNRALVQEASGKGYIIKKGTYVGIHSGKVSQILKDKVIVAEEDEDFMGNVTIRERELKLQKPPGEEYYDF